MNTDTLDFASAYLQEALACTFDELLQPISPALAAGVSLKGSELMRAITQARSRDDPHLDRGIWQHDLRRADWPLVSRLCVDGLLRHSKDLQLATFLADARLEQDRFVAMTPMLELLRRLLEQFGNDLHPQPVNGDQSHRSNLLRSWLRRTVGWMRVAALAAHTDVSACSWADWEAAQAAVKRHSAAHSEAGAAAQQAFSDLQGRVDSWSATELQQLHRHLGQAAVALARLDQTMERLWGQDAPTVDALMSLSASLRDWAGGQLQRRGISVREELAAAGAVTADPGLAPTATQDGAPMAPLPSDDSPPTLREQAYVALAQIAWQLRQIEPHSPVPYLLQRALEWGQMDTAELYQEVFIRQGGQMSIFEILGLQLPDADAKAAA